MQTQRANQLVVASVLAVVSLASLLLALSIHSARAQTGGEIFVDKRLGRVNPVVHVGEYLTFTILIRNDAAFTVTTLPLSDTYNAAVLGYADALPPPDSINVGTGRLDWNDLTAFFGDIAPGQQIVVVVGFVAEHPAPAVVNAAEVHDAISASGSVTGTNSTITDTESVGGSSPVGKELLLGLVPQVGLPLTFTILITNEGYTTMTVVPLVDTYNPSLLQFNYAVPPPDLVNAASGVLTWTDITSWTGDVSARATISVTTVFTALAAVENTANRAEVSAARDWYDNDLAGGSDEVPITIIEGPTPTPAPTATPAPGPTRTPGPTGAPTQPAPTPTIVAVPTPAFLPTSGKAYDVINLGMLTGLLILGMGITVLFVVRREKAA